MRKVTCGIIIKVNNTILLGHSTGNKHWDIPKGLKDEGESFKEAALRETLEETGLNLYNEDLKDIGQFKLNSSKDIYLFEVKLNNINMDKLHCESMVELPNIKPFPEVDGFGLFENEEVLNKVSKSLKALLINLL